MKILIFKSFKEGENLAKFVNEKKIAKEDILSVTSKNPGHSIFYYGEPDEDERNKNWFSGFSD